VHIRSALNFFLRDISVAVYIRYVLKYLMHVSVYILSVLKCFLCNVNVSVYTRSVLKFF
jgi:hypothetical protein